jgi:hypothetical protein
MDELAAGRIDTVRRPFIRGPALQPWALRVAYVANPCGILWHVAQLREGILHD